MGQGRAQDWNEDSWQPRSNVPRDPLRRRRNQIRVNHWSPIQPYPWLLRDVDANAAQDELKRRESHRSPCLLSDLANRRDSITEKHAGELLGVGGQK